MPPQWLVIGISGITCGGKTSLALSLRDFFINRRTSRLWNSKYVISDVQLISQDDYFLPVDDLRHKWVEKLNAINFEVLTSLDMKQMLSDITWTMKGRYLAVDNSSTTTPPDYLAEITTFQNATKLNILIIEGFLIFNQPELLQICQLKFHFHLPYEKCFARRELRTYDPPDVTGYFEMCVWPFYEKNFAEFRERKDLIILNGEMCKDKIFKYVLQRINVYLSEMMTSPCLMDQ
ncbi:nicotinamide riboside kinase 1 [Episyrphus balteatus]|uniref:nicotinamide riboside kinase 1 n=1 Tax=Episyrphus balteatus TaxID=286459 RepID=UPI002485673F|nr:nicotinamide riboside kinase 1 [Episyrphus balteatus]